jgi:hypothetical protein
MLKVLKGWTQPSGGNGDACGGREAATLSVDDPK